MLVGIIHWLIFGLFALWKRLSREQTFFVLHISWQKYSDSGCGAGFTLSILLLTSFMHFSLLASLWVRDWSSRLGKNLKIFHFEERVPADVVLQSRLYFWWSRFLCYYPHTWRRMCVGSLCYYPHTFHCLGFVRITKAKSVIKYTIWNTGYRIIWIYADHITVDGVLDNLSVLHIYGASFISSSKLQPV